MGSLQVWSYPSILQLFANTQTVFYTLGVKSSRLSSQPYFLVGVECCALRGCYAPSDKSHIRSAQRTFLDVLGKLLALVNSNVWEADATAALQCTPQLWIGTFARFPGQNCITFERGPSLPRLLPSPGATLSRFQSAITLG